jgi:exo-beta-1,3-glucanase (GH17 family)
MLKALGIFSIVAAAIVAAWWRMGEPVDMPRLPLDVSRKLPCVSYAPFRGAQTPYDPAVRIAPERIEEDLALLSRHADCVRTYSIDRGLERVPDIARKYGLKVMLGLAVSGDTERTRYQIEVGSGLARRFSDVVEAVVVGSEALSRGEVAPAALAESIRTVKARVPMPVTYADGWATWIAHPQLAAAVDFVTVHILPYREREPAAADEAVDQLDAIRKRVAASFIGKEIAIGEAGWPGAGRMRGAALPSPANQARFVHDLLARAKRESVRINVLEAFDQPWKRGVEGSAGGYWGLFGGVTRERKFAWDAPVSDRPHWRGQAAGGVAVAALVFIAGFAGRRRGVPEPGVAVWSAIALNAFTAGWLAGWIAEAAAIESVGWTGLLRTAAFGALALAAPLAVAVAMTSRVACPDFSQVFGPKTLRAPGVLAKTLGLLAVVLTVLALQAALGLAFEPGLRDFPFAPLTAAAVPFVLLMLVAPRPSGPRPAAETVAAAMLLPCAIYVAWSEGLANWQALWFCGAVLLVAVTLLRPRAAPS